MGRAHTSALLRASPGVLECCPLPGAAARGPDAGSPPAALPALPWARSGGSLTLPCSSAPGTAKLGKQRARSSPASSGAGTWQTAPPPCDSSASVPQSPCSDTGQYTSLTVIVAPAAVCAGNGLLTSCQEPVCTKADKIPFPHRLTLAQSHLRACVLLRSAASFVAHPAQRNCPIVTSRVGLQSKDTISLLFCLKENVKNSRECFFLFSEPTEILYLPCLPLKPLQISCMGYICSLLIGVGKSLLGVSLEFMMIFAVFFPGR